MRNPPKIHTNEPEEIPDEVIINSVNVNYQLPSINLLKTIKSASNKENEVKAKANISELEKESIKKEKLERANEEIRKQKLLERAKSQSLLFSQNQENKYKMRDELIKKYNLLEKEMKEKEEKREKEKELKLYR